MLRLVTTGRTLIGCGLPAASFNVAMCISAGGEVDMSIRQTLPCRSPPYTKSILASTSPALKYAPCLIKPEGVTVLPTPVPTLSSTCPTAVFPIRRWT